MYNIKQDLKICSTRLRQIRHFTWGRLWWIRSWYVPSKEKLEAFEYLKQHQDYLMFVFGSGRSGTQLISDLVALSGKVKVFHEPNFTEDVATMDRFRKDQISLMKYWTRFRCMEVYKRWRQTPENQYYSEVNGTIRYHAPVLIELFPRAKFFLMARDGRGVVRSVMGWPLFYHWCSTGAHNLKPLSGDPIISEWHSMDKFEKLCWAWSETNDFLMKHIPSSNWLQLERITSDYDYFVEKFNSKFSTVLSHNQWKQSVEKKSRNATKEYGFPTWDNWSNEQKQSFIRICGPTMTRLGYII